MIGARYGTCRQCGTRPIEVLTEPVPKQMITERGKILDTHSAFGPLLCPNCGAALPIEIERNRP